MLTHASACATDAEYRRLVELMLPPADEQSGARKATTLPSAADDAAVLEAMDRIPPRYP